MKYRNILKKRILAGLLAGAAACAAAPAVLAAGSPVANDTLPQLADPDKPFFAGQGYVDLSKDNQMTIHQNSQNAVIKWDSFNVGANATVNFEKGENYNGGDRFNTLNYVNQANGMSQIYGAISAAEGNIYIVNPAGVEISNSAQINVGSLYVSNKKMTDENLSDFQNKAGLDAIYNIQGETQDAVLMSLGNINANRVTFDGNRIVIDTERLKDVNGDAKLTKDKITVLTNNAANVVIGYDAYNEGDNKGTYEGKQVAASSLATIDEKGQEVINLNAYMWVEDVEQLQAIGENADTLKGNYALRNSIDATATQDWADNSGTGKGFVSIGSDGEGNSFTGKFDGLDYNIFNLNIDRDTDNVGLFGVVGDKAVINNVTLVGGSIAGDNYVGALAGLVQGDASISNITNSAKVSGTTSVGGVIGQSDGGKYTNLVNTGTVTGNQNNIGGLIGKMENSTLGGTSYNLGAVTAKDAYNVGGLVGHAVNSVIGNEDTKDEEGQTVQGTTVYNRLNVTGAFNVGGIVGHMEGTTVQNAENSGTIAATGYDSNGKYSYHTAHYTGSDVVNGVKTENVNIANAGGIAGSASNVDGQESKIENAVNTGDVSSAVKSENGYDYYEAGNVGGIVGSAVDTNITNATNRENEIRGAHNVGGVAGYFSGSSTVNGGINDGGDILATGGRYNGDFVKEWVRAGTNGGEEAIVGNMGGIVGYMEGDEAYITASANRGTVHSQDITGTTVQPMSQAANAGGIVGKIDRSSTKDADTVKGDYTSAAVSNSYNTGDVRGYMGVGGVAGMMYNGEIAGSYNLGTIQTTRNAQSFGPGEYYSVNMGGIVGDTTENAKASALLYDVYNKGQIGDENFEYYARHVGGIVGRLSGTVEKAYNTGAIYNGYNVVGGIAGWFYTGSISNSFNTGNITVVNKEGLAGESKVATSQVGGIVGAAQAANHIVINGVYNLGTLRVFRPKGATGATSLGGIIGAIRGERGSIDITNAYTTGNLYAAAYDDDTNDYKLQVYSLHLGSIYGHKENSNTEITLTNTYYIKPEQTENGQFAQYVNGTDINYLFPVIGGNMKIDGRVYKIGIDNSNKAIDFDKKGDINQYKFDGGITNPQANGDMGANVDESFAWRIYEGSTPILNAFLPNTEDYFAGEKEGITPDLSGIGSIQYGTAYDPLLTIINANGNKANLEFNWIDLGANNAAGIAVYGAGLTLNDFKATGGSGYYAGLLYADGALSIHAEGDASFGSAAELYGSSVTIDAKGDVTIYGDVTATGNTKDGTTVKEDGSYEKLKNFTTDGRISITGGNVDIYGQLTSGAGGETVKGIGSIAEGWTPGDVSDPKAAMSDIGDRFGYTTGASAATGNISITANDTEDGHVNVYYGNKGEGIITTGGSLEVTASGDIYMDSDLSIGGNLTLKAGQIKDSEGNLVTAVDSEAVLDISNIGKVQAANDAPDSEKTSVDYLHEFMHHFRKGEQNGGQISFTGGESKIAVDMWDEEINKGKGGFNLDKFDIVNDKFVEDLNHLNFKVTGDTEANAQKYTYIWVSTGEQLAGIQEYYNDPENKGTQILSYNFALKNDIDASDVTDYEAIGTGAENGYTGTFDGRDNRIIGLKMEAEKDSDGNGSGNAGIFDTIGVDGQQVGTVEDLRVYSGTFTGTNNAGAVAGVNNGSISNVTTFGNVVQSAGNAGGIVGQNVTVSPENPENIAEITNVSAIGIATANGKNAIAGGIAGTNTGKISNSSTNSAVDSSSGGAAALGGVAGVNEGTLDNVDSLGVTTGLYKLEGHNSTKENQYSDNVGGIVGTNSGTVTNAYNESIVSGRDNVGGILGTNTVVEGKDNLVSNVANASSVTGEADANAAEDKDKTSDYVGGLVGNNEGSITNGRNNGEITGNNYVGGLVGANGKDSTLTNLVNDESAAITGDKWVGGIAGSNAGKITASSVDEDGHVIEGNDNLINRGTITGVQYVGGVAGINTGTITNTNNDVDLHVKDGATDAIYFGGVAGSNESGGTITDATNQANVSAGGASHVGGIVGKNDGTLSGMNGNYGNVSGKDYVGGVAGENTQRLEDVTAVNQGSVIASDGGAGGIFAVNGADASIVNSHLTSSGTVTGTTGDGKSGTGGIFGVNYGAISGSTLENKGYTDENGFHDSLVTGTSNTGGLIGINYGKVETSSLKNEADIEVIGDSVSNIGGLIGQNSGDITGGRDENDWYYQYQIYNNGTITVEGKGSNIGGLFGTNEGKVTAGYNTGAVIAENSTNVGGIAGTNSGTLEQVFNTVITGVNENGSTAYGSITGGTNVGGIAGTNTKNGTISNAYNTTAIAGTVSGAIAGANSGAISNVYGSEKGTLVDSGKLVGSGSDTVSNVYDSENDTFGDGGSAIDKKGGASASTTPWRQYGDNNPILKVFLTTVTYDETKNDQNLVYNGKDQTLDIDGLITSSAFDAADKFDAHKNVEGGLIFHDKETSINAGKYTDDFWSIQIGAGKDGNPNNLGYDVQSVKYKIGKATIAISLDNIYRLYGSENMYQDANRTRGSNAYEDYWRISVGNADDFDQDALNAALGSIRDNAVIVDNGKGTNGRTTADAGDHNWQVQVNISNIASNFQLKDQEGATTHSYEYANGSHVAKAELTVTVGNVETTYGTAFDPTKYGYKLDGVTNGDTSDAVKELIGQVDYTNDAAKDGTGGVWTADAGTYTDAVGVTQNGTALDSVEDLLKNYTVKVDKGDAQVNKAELEIIADDKEMYAGDTIPAFTGTDISSQLVNGDTLSGWYYGPEGAVDSSVGGSHIIGVHFGNGQYAGSNSFDWTTAWDGFKNYNVTFTPGTFTVRDFPEGMPDISDIPSIERHWNFLFDDNPWDRNRDFRERKAEVHFVAGGMTL